MHNNHEYTAVIIETKTGYIGLVLDVPGAITQGNTEEVVKERLKDAIGCIFEANVASTRSVFDERIISANPLIDKSKVRPNVTLTCY